MEDRCLINLWVNEERYEKLNKAGLSDVAEDVLAGMKAIKLYCTVEQKEKILQMFPLAKYDASTTKSIELIPVQAKNFILDLVIQKKTVDIFDEFLSKYSLQ